jgi:hypothetical protein
MENLDDENIQRLIEEQLKSYQTNAVYKKDEDAALYRVLFVELEKKHLSNKESSLAERVIRQIEMKQERMERIHDSIFIFAILFFISILTYSAIALNNDVLPGRVIHFFVANRFICGFIVLTFFCIQLMDRHIEKRRNMQTTDNQ